MPGEVLIGDFVFDKLDSINTLCGYVGNESNLTLPESYNGESYAIGEKVFYGYTSLESITIPNSVTTIGSSAFRGCSSLTSITIPNSVTTIGNGAFEGCTALKKVINLSNLSLTKGSTEHGYVAYYADKVYNVPGEVLIGDFVFDKLDSINTLCGYVGNESNLTLPESYNGESYAIGEKVFYGYTSLESITIPNSVTTIGSSAFYGCSSLTSVTIPNSVTTIGKDAFSNCKELKSATICDGVKSIGAYAFAGCNNMETLYISSTIEGIGNCAFTGCNNIFEIKTASKKAVTASENVFSSDAYINACLYVPAGRKFAYEKATPWNNFYIVEMDFTGIDEVLEDVKTEPAVDTSQNVKMQTIYDLNGRAVENPSNGIYIVNGKKMLVK